MRRWSPALAAALVLLVAGLVYANGLGSGLFRDPIAPVDLGPVPVAEPDRVRFVLVGDAGHVGAIANDVAAGVKTVCTTRGCDFGVLLGDNLYPAGMDGPEDPDMDAAFAPFEAALTPWYVALGNHDYGDSTEEERADWQVAWADRHPGYRLPSRSYAFTAGPARIFVLDTVDVFWWGGGAQAAWLADGLAASDARWKVVFGHHTWRSSGEHGNAGAYEGRSGIPYVSGDLLRLLFETELCGNVQLYASGHDHHLEWNEVCGVQNVVSGGGSARRPLEDRGNQPRFAAGEPGFAWVELADEMTVAFYGRDGSLLHEGKAPHVVVR